MITRPLSRPLTSALTRALTSPGAGGGGFDPVAVFGSDLLWLYEAADASTLGQTSAGVSSVAVGDPIGYIADKSVNARRLAASTDARRIKLGEDGSGFRFFNFDGTRPIGLDTLSINLSSVDKVTVFFVGAPADTAGTNKVPFYFNPTATNHFAAIFNATTATGRLYDGTVTKAPAFTGVTTAVEIYEFEFSANEGRTLNAIRGGFDGREWGWQRGSLAEGNTGPFANAVLRFGDWTGSTTSWIGSIYAMAAVAGDISDSERARLRAYLADLGGVAYPLEYVGLNFSHAGNYRVQNSNNGFAAYAYSALYFDTPATSVDVSYYADSAATLLGYTSIGVEVDGEYLSATAPAGTGIQTATISLPAGSKRVGLINSAVTGNSNGNYGTSTRILNATFNEAATPYVEPSGGILIYGDSVACGGHASPILENAWPLALRRGYSTNVSVYAESGRAFKTDYDNPGTGHTLRDALVPIIQGYGPDILWFAMGVNDYSQANWTAAAFGTAYAAVLDSLNSAMPSLQVYAQSPLNPAHGSTPNALGDTLQDYCDAIQAACVGRAWATYVDGAAIITDPGTELTDGVHPNNAGNAAYASYVATLLGLTP